MDNKVNFLIILLDHDLDTIKFAIRFDPSKIQIQEDDPKDWYEYYKMPDNRKVFENVLSEQYKEYKIIEIIKLDGFVELHKI